MKKEATVSTPCPQYEEMLERWELPMVLWGGTHEIREKALETVSYSYNVEEISYLPREPKEDYTAWRNRLQRSVLYGAYKRTIMSLAGLPFHRAAVIYKEPEELSYLKEDCDSDNSDITDFAHDILTDCLHFGKAHFLVDMPAVGESVSLADQEKYKIRPYFSRISPANLIAWTSEKIGGSEVLTSIRIKEDEVIVPDGWGFKELERIRVITPEAHYIFQENVKNKDEYDLIEEIPNNFGSIPLVTIYGNRTGFMTAEPMLEDLAWLNLRHFQKLSDLDNIEHVANVPILLATGVDDNQLEGISVGPNALINFSSETADLKYVEHSGAAIEASQKSLEKLEERMAAMGADLIIRKSVDRQTATARLLDSSESVSLLQIVINNVETGIAEGFRIASEWIDVKSDTTVSIGSWLDAGNGANLIDILAQFIIDSKKLSVEEAVKELQRRGVLSDTFEIEDGPEITQNGSSTQSGSDSTQNGDTLQE